MLHADAALEARDVDGRQLLLRRRGRAPLPHRVLVLLTALLEVILLALVLLAIALFALVAAAPPAPVAAPLAPELGALGAAQLHARLADGLADADGAAHGADHSDHEEDPADVDQLARLDGKVARVAHHVGAVRGDEAQLVVGAVGEGARREEPVPDAVVRDALGYQPVGRGAVHVSPVQLDADGPELALGHPPHLVVVARGEQGLRVAVDGRLRRGQHDDEVLILKVVVRVLRIRECGMPL
mmetsp:Transcript_23054/g.77346  ORF Transcript_23054/g.77346 Transcript_23054/m.77346 type:complete len:242 (+) Transcript_23054:336-1061(+)